MGYKSAPGCSDTSALKQPSHYTCQSQVNVDEGHDKSRHGKLAVQVDSTNTRHSFDHFTQRSHFLEAHKMRDVTRHGEEGERAVKVENGDNDDDQGCATDLDEAPDIATLFRRLEKSHFVNCLVEDFLKSTRFIATRPDAYYGRSYMQSPYQTEQTQEPYIYRVRSARRASGVTPGAPPGPSAPVEDAVFMDDEDRFSCSSKFGLTDIQNPQALPWSEWPFPVPDGVGSFPTLDVEQMYASTSNSFQDFISLDLSELPQFPGLEEFVDQGIEQPLQVPQLSPIVPSFTDAKTPDLAAPEPSRPHKRQNIQLEEQDIESQSMETKSCRNADVPYAFANDPYVFANDEPGRLLACPYQKWKPLTYRKCRTMILKSVARVKQHLWRSHMIPIHCPLCFTEFRREEERDAHARLQTCSIQQPKQWEGISSTKRTILKRRVKTSLSKEEQWYEMYEILFPGSPKPTTPYVDTTISGDILALQDFMANEWKSTFDRLAQEKIPPALAQQKGLVKKFANSVLEDALEVLFNRLESDYLTKKAPELADGEDGIENS